MANRKYILEYDSEADAAYIRLEKKKIVDSVEIGSNIIADLDSRKKVVGIEILNFSKKRVAVTELIAKGIENIMAAA